MFSTFPYIEPIINPKVVFDARVLLMLTRWDDVIGVEWGSSWPSDSGKNVGHGYGDGDRCYELYYTVPDELRRPWQVTGGQSIPSRIQR